MWRPRRKRAGIGFTKQENCFTVVNDAAETHARKNPTRWGVVVETPTYDLTVFKVHYGKMTLKIYTNGARVLRVEVIVHNTEEYRWGPVAALLLGKSSLACAAFWRDS